MAIDTTRAAALIIEHASNVPTLIWRVREAVGDVDTSSANQRWSDAQITDAINLEIMKMSNQLNVRDAASSLTSLNISYTADATSVALTSPANVQPIYRVEDITSSTTRPTPLDRTSNFAMEQHGQIGDQAFSSRYVWALEGGNIAVRPIPTKALTLRVWYLQGPYAIPVATDGTPADATDQHPMPVGNEELITLGAAIRLQETDAEIPPVRVARYGDLWLRFLATSKRFLGPKFVRRNRRWVS